MGPAGSLKSISNYPPPIQLQRSNSTAVPRLVAEVRPTTLVGGAKYGTTGQSKGYLQLPTSSNPTPTPEAEAEATSGNFADDLQTRGVWAKAVIAFFNLQMGTDASTTSNKFADGDGCFNDHHKFADGDGYFNDQQKFADGDGCFNDQQN